MQKINPTVSDADIREMAEEIATGYLKKNSIADFSLLGNKTKSLTEQSFLTRKNRMKELKLKRYYFDDIKNLIRNRQSDFGEIFTFDKVNNLTPMNSLENRDFVKKFITNKNNMTEDYQYAHHTGLWVITGRDAGNRRKVADYIFQHLLFVSINYKIWEETNKFSMGITNYRTLVESGDSYNSLCSLGCLYIREWEDEDIENKNKAIISNRLLEFENSESFITTIITIDERNLKQSEICSIGTWNQKIKVVEV